MTAVDSSRPAPPSRRRAGCPGHRAARGEGQARLPAHAGRRRADLDRRGPGQLRQARRGVRDRGVHHRPRAVPGDDRRQHRHAGHRGRDFQLPGARPGPDVPGQQRRVRDRPALGARGSGRQGLRRPQGQEDIHHDRDHRARVPRQRAARQQYRCERRRDRQPAHERGSDFVHLWRRTRGRAVGAVQHHCQEGPGRKMLVDASAYYPKAAIVGGWATRRISTGRIARPARTSSAAGPRRTTT